MPRKYSRKTNWGSTPLEEMQRAATEVQGGKSIRKVATERKIDRSTLRRFLKKKEGGAVRVAGYTGTANAKRVFTEEMEEDLANHVKKLSDQFHGLTAKKCRDLAFEMAERNNIPVPESWKDNRSAGSVEEITIQLR